MEYLTKNQKLIERLKQLGYIRKNINIFRKIESESILDLFFSHYTSGEPHVKYYTVNINVTYPSIEKIKQKRVCQNARAYVFHFQIVIRHE